MRQDIIYDIFEIRQSEILYRDIYSHFLIVCVLSCRSYKDFINDQLMIYVYIDMFSVQNFM